MGINEIIMYIMMFFMLIAAVDRILSQFGGSARFLGKFGKSIEGSGGQFEEGFMAMGALGLAMVGMTALAPVLAHVLGPGNDSNLLIVFYVQIMPDDFVMQLHRF